MLHIIGIQAKLEFFEILTFQRHAGMRILPHNKTSTKVTIIVRKASQKKMTELVKKLRLEKIGYSCYC